MKAYCTTKNPQFYITPRKRYEVIDLSFDAFGRIKDFTIEDLFCLPVGCAHLNGADWTLVPETPEEKELINGK